MKKKVDKSVGAMITEVRETLRISQAELGRRLNVTPQSINRYEREKVAIDASVLLFFAHLAASDERTENLVRELVKPVAHKSGLSAASLVLAAALSSVESAGLPDSKTLSRIAKRAAELLKE